MTKETKMYLGIGLVAVAGYMIFTSGKKNAIGKTRNTDCRTVAGNVSVAIGTRVQTASGTEYIVRTGNGTTTLCKKTWSFF